MAASPRKAVCTLACGPQVELAELAREPLDDFAARHGYDIVVEDASRAPDRPLSWSKVPLLRELLGAYDVVLWVDADAIVVDPSGDPAGELEDDRFLYVVQHRFAGQDALNCGVLMLRSCPDALAFLDEVWSRDEFVVHPYWEQAAVLTLLGYELGSPYLSAHLVRPTQWLTRTKLLSHEWNSIALDPAPRPRIKHYAGETHEARVAGMTADLEAYRRRARILAEGPGRFPSSIVLPLAGTLDDAWAAVGAVASLPEAPAHEVVLVDDGSGRYASVLAAVEGDVKVVTAPGGLAAAAAAGAAAAEGGVVAVLAEPPTGDDWLRDLVEPVAARRASVAVRARRAGGGLEPTVLAIARDELAAAGGVPLAGETLGGVCSAFAATGRQPAVVAVD